MKLDATVHYKWGGHATFTCVNPGELEVLLKEKGYTLADVKSIEFKKESA